MIWSEGVIARAVATQTLARKCVVLVDRCNWTGRECDVLAVTTDLRVIDVEVKISRADFKADASKEKWWHRRNNWRFECDNAHYAQHGAPAPDMRRQWPPRVWKHYFAVPADIWTDELLEFMPSPACGLLLAREHRGAVELNCARRAKPNGSADRLSPADAVDIARLANLRMWDAYARLDRLAEVQKRAVAIEEGALQ